MTDTQREAFEAHMRSRGEDYLYRRDAPGCTRLGEYCRENVQECWLTWQAAQAALSGAAQEGWRLVPVEPTPDMKIAGDNAGFWCADKWRAMIDAAPSAPAAPAVAPAPKSLNAPDIILSGAQLLEAIDFIAPDRATDPDQLESEVAFWYGEGHSGKAMYIWCAEYPEEGSFVCDGSSVTAAPAQAEQQGEPKAPPGYRLQPISEYEAMCAFVRGEQQGGNPPFANCSFRICDLPGQCRGEGECHHPKAEQQGDGGARNARLLAMLKPGHGLPDAPVEQPSARVELSDERILAVFNKHRNDMTHTVHRVFFEDEWDETQIFEAGCVTFARAILAASAAQTGESK